MSIPLIIFLYIYLVILVVIIILGFFNVYHLMRFSFWDTISFFALFLFLAVMVIGLLFSLIEISQIDWQQKIDLNFGNPFAIDNNTFSGQ